MEDKEIPEMFNKLSNENLATLLNMAAHRTFIFHRKKGKQYKIDWATINGNKIQINIK